MPFVRPGRYIFGLLMPHVPPPPARPSRMQYQNGPLGDDDYEIEEGSTIMQCKLIFKLLLEMTMKVIRFFTEHTFTDRSAEMALFFANVLFLAGFNYTIRRAPSPSRGAKKQFVLTVNTPGNDVDYQITITVSWTENERLNTSPASSASPSCTRARRTCTGGSS